MYNDKMDKYLQFLEQIEISQTFVEKGAKPIYQRFWLMSSTNK